MHTLVIELVGKPVGAKTRAAKHQNLVEVARFYEVHQQLALFLARDGMNDVRDEFGDCIAPRNLDQHRGVEHRIGEFLDFVRESRRKKQALSLFGQKTDDALDVWNEAHVEHAVGLIEHQHLDLRQVDGALLHVVEQAARRGHHDFDAAS